MLAVYGILKFSVLNTHFLDSGSYSIFPSIIDFISSSPQVLLIFILGNECSITYETLVTISLGVKSITGVGGINSSILAATSFNVALVVISSKVDSPNLAEIVSNTQVSPSYLKLCIFIGATITLGDGLLTLIPAFSIIL